MPLRVIVTLYNYTLNNERRCVCVCVHVPKTNSSILVLSSFVFNSHRVLCNKKIDYKLPSQVIKEPGLVHTQRHTQYYSIHKNTIEADGAYISKGSESACIHAYEYLHAYTYIHAYAYNTCLCITCACIN